MAVARDPRIHGLLSVSALLYHGVSRRERVRTGATGSLALWIEHRSRSGSLFFGVEWITKAKYYFCNQVFLPRRAIAHERYFFFFTVTSYAGSSDEREK